MSKDVPPGDVVTLGLFTVNLPCQEYNYCILNYRFLEITMTDYVHVECKI